MLRRTTLVAITLLLVSSISLRTSARVVAPPALILASRSAPQSLLAAQIGAIKPIQTKKKPRKRRYTAASFAYGNCTRYAASQFGGTDWLGNGGQWYQNARLAGYEVGKTPRVGAIMVTREGWYTGHVAIVRNVNSNGSWQVQEMNYLGFNIVSKRTIRRGFKLLIGFIYQPA